MRFLTVQYISWASCWLLWWTLVFVLYRRRSYRVMPVFFLWACELCVETTTLFLIDRYGTAATYGAAYWLFALLEICLQIAVAWEFADAALRKGESWVCGSKTPFTMSVTCALLLAFLFTFQSVPAASNAVDSVYTQLSLFSSLSVFFMCIVSLGFAYQYGALWHTNDLYRFGGFLLWSSVSAFTDTMHVYSKTREHFEYIDWFHMIFSLGIVVYWIATSHLSSVQVHTRLPAGKEALEFLHAYDGGSYSNGNPEV